VAGTEAELSVPNAGCAIDDFCTTFAQLLAYWHEILQQVVASHP